MLRFGPTGSGYVARVEGSGTMRESPAFSSLVSEILNKEDETRVLLDLSCCEYLDSTFLGSLLMLHKRYAQVPPPRFAVSVPQDVRKKFLAPICLDRILVIVDEDVRCPVEWMTLEAGDVSIRDLGRHSMEAHQKLAELECPQAAAFQQVADGLAKDLKVCKETRSGEKTQD